MNPWYKVVTLRHEVRQGRSFSPDEFAIALEQVVEGTAPSDYCDPVQFFSRTCFTRALKEHVEKVLHRLSGKTENTAPVLTLITQFGGGKTHILTSLYHIAKAGMGASEIPGVSDLLREAQISAIPNIRVGVFVGNAWDPTEGNETPWIDLARQIAGEQGVQALGTSALTVPPGTRALSRVFACADAPVLLLFDEVLNFVNRHRNMADQFHAFIQNLSVAVTGSTSAAAVISLPRSQVEMTDWDQQWQEKITKIVRRVSEDIFANDESEISEVICRRLFEDRGTERMRRKIAKVYADWCFERSDHLPPQWLTVDTALKGARAREALVEIFASCYPFHPATLSVFRRKWSALSQFQQTRGTLAMLAQWISIASLKQYKDARNEPLITLGSAPLEIPEFRSVVLGQLGEPRLDVAINADIAGKSAHARALDADAPKDLREIHQRVGTAILFESSGGQVNKVAQLSELRFALGEPSVDITAIDNAASALEGKGFFIRELGGGYKVHHQATLRKVVSDYRSSLNVETEIKPAIDALVEKEFRHGTTLKVIPFPEDSPSVQDTYRLILVILDPQMEWSSDGSVKQHIHQWTKRRGQSPRLYPGSLIWCAKSPGQNLREKVEIWIAWKKVERDISRKILGSEFDQSERANVQSYVKQAEEAARNEVWASYRFIILSDVREKDGLKVINLGVGYSSSRETLCGRVIAALKSEGLLNENVGVSYIERHWPPVFKDNGAWPLMNLRKSFLDGSLTRLPDPETILRRQIIQFVSDGEFGLASGTKDDGEYHRVWYKKQISHEDVEFAPDVFLLTKSKALSKKTGTTPTETLPTISPEPSTDPSPIIDPPPGTEDIVLNVTGTMPSEIWNRFGTKVLPKLRSLSDLHIKIEISSKVGSPKVEHTKAELQSALSDLGLSDKIRVE